MTHELTPSQPYAIDRPLTMRHAGAMADDAARRNVFRLYLDDLAENTRRRHRAALDLFAEFLATDARIGDAPAGAELYDDPSSWADVTFGLVLAFREWMLQRGYAIGSVNGRLSTVRTFAKLANDAGALRHETAEQVQGVRGVGRRRDEKRDVTRIGYKAAAPIVLTAEQVRSLKQQPDDAQGLRDRLIVTLLVDHGLRISELVGLSVGSVDLTERALIFYRPKVNKWQTIELTGDALTTVTGWLDCDASPQAGPLLKTSKRHEGITRAGLTERAIAMRLEELGQAIGVEGLSPHDLRHTWATRYVRTGGTLEELKEAGGWNSLAMPARYVSDNAVTPAHNGLGY